MFKEILMSAMILFNSSISNSLVNANQNSFNNVSVQSNVDTDISNEYNICSYDSTENYFSKGTYDYINKKSYLTLVGSYTTCESIYRGINASNYTKVASPSFYFGFNNVYNFIDDLSSLSLTEGTILSYYFIYSYVISGTRHTSTSTYTKLIVFNSPSVYLSNFSSNIYSVDTGWNFKISYNNYSNCTYCYKEFYLDDNVLINGYSNLLSHFSYNNINNNDFYYNYIGSYFRVGSNSLLFGKTYSCYIKYYYMIDFNLDNKILVYESQKFNFTVGYKTYYEEFALFNKDLKNKTCELDSFLLYSNTSSLKIEYYLNDVLKYTKELTGVADTTIVGSETYDYSFSDTGYTFTDLELYTFYNCYFKIYSGDTLIQTSITESFEFGSLMYYEEFAVFTKDNKALTCELDSFLLYGNVQNITINYYLNNELNGSNKLVGVEDYTEIGDGSYTYSYNGTGYTFKNLYLDTSYDVYFKIYDTDTNKLLITSKVESFILSVPNSKAMDIYNVYLNNIYSSGGRVNFSYYSAYTPITIYIYLNDNLLSSNIYTNVPNQKYNTYFDFTNLEKNTKYNFEIQLLNTISFNNVVSTSYKGSFNTSSVSQYGEVVNLPSLMFNILSMPFAFFSNAFNLTLFSGTPYAINIGDVIMFIISLVILIAIIKMIMNIKG